MFQKVKPEEQEYKKRTYHNLIHFIKLGLTDSVKFYLIIIMIIFFDLSLRDNNGYTLLSLAIAVDKEDLFDYLIEKGFSISDEVKNGSNILHVALFRKIYFYS